MTQTKTAIVTGASSGIGLALTQKLLGHGYAVVANSRRITASDQLRTGDRLVLVDGDVADPATAEKLVKTAVERFGRLDLVVNNAGFFLPKPFTEYSVEDLDRLLATNLKGVVWLAQAAVKQMTVQGNGHLVTITTSLADQPIRGVAAALPLLIKGGLNTLTKALALEFSGAGIRVNAVAPGIIDTPMHAPEAHTFLKTLHPIERLGTVDEIAEAVLYLDGAHFVTGEVLHVDGGAHAGKW